MFRNGEMICCDEKWQWQSTRGITNTGKICNSAFMTYYSSILLGCLFLFPFHPCFLCGETVAVWGSVGMAVQHCVLLLSWAAWLESLNSLVCLPLSKNLNLIASHWYINWSKAFLFSQILSPHTAASLDLPVLFFSVASMGLRILAGTCRNFCTVNKAVVWAFCLKWVSFVYLPTLLSKKSLENEV